MKFEGGGFEQSPQGETGVTMEDLVTVIKDIEGLRRERVEDRNDTQNAFGELNRQVQALKGLLSDLPAKIEGLEGRVDERVEKCVGEACERLKQDFETKIERVAYTDTGEIQRCVDGMCQRIEGRLGALEKRVEVEEEGEDDDDAEETGNHRTAEEYLRCETCGPEITRTIAQSPDFLRKVLASAKKQKDFDFDALLKEMAPEQKKQTGGDVNIWA